MTVTQEDDAARFFEISQVVFSQSPKSDGTSKPFTARSKIEVMILSNTLKSNTQVMSDGGSLLGYAYSVDSSAKLYDSWASLPPFHCRRCRCGD